MFKLFVVYIVLILAVKLEPASSQTVCVDKVTNCREQLTIINYCNSTDLEIREFFITQCPRSCLVLHQVVSGACGPTCNDGIQNQLETGVDCGGPCPACGPTCNDGIQNQLETGVDCGGPCPACAPTCNDGVQNQLETGIDCGGPCPACKTPCNPNPCQNNGTCFVVTSPKKKTTRTSYFCICTEGFTGQNCTTKPCEDTSTKCAKFVPKFCTTNKFVMEKCKASCGLCATTPKETSLSPYPSTAPPTSINSEEPSTSLSPYPSTAPPTTINSEEPSTSLPPYPSTAPPTTINSGEPSTSLPPYPSTAPPTTPKEPCVDTSPKCARFVPKYCTKSKRVMENCKASCGICTPQTTLEDYPSTAEPTSKYPSTAEPTIKSSPYPSTAESSTYPSTPLRRLCSARLMKTCRCGCKNAGQPEPKTKCSKKEKKACPCKCNNV